MMHPEQRALLDGIIANPEDNVRRGAYADWLDEHEEGDICPHCNGDGEEEHAVYCDGVYEIDVRECSSCKGTGGASNKFAKRAAFIRKQCENPLGSWPGFKYGLNVVWRRGFIAEVSCTMKQWVEYGPEIARYHPVERVTITDKEPAEINGKYHWLTSSNLAFAGHMQTIPPAIHDTLDANRANAYGFKSVELANAALSQACIVTAREKANQPADSLPLTSWPQRGLSLTQIDL